MTGSTFPPGAVRALLLEVTELTDVIPAARIGSSNPTSLVAPYARLDLLDTAGVNTARGATRPLVQVTLACGAGAVPDPDELLHRLAGVVAREVARTRNRVWQGLVWSGYREPSVLGPSLDTSRGADGRTWFAQVQAQLTTRTT